MIGPFSIDTYLPSFPAIARDFGVGTLELQQTLSVYLASFVVMTLFHGTLSDSFGRRPVILAGLEAGFADPEKRWRTKGDGTTNCRETGLFHFLGVVPAHACCAGN